MTNNKEPKQEIVPAKSKNKTALIQISPEVLIAQAIDKGVPVETMERLLAMRRELKAEQSKEAYDRAMSAFQSECQTIEKTKKVLNKDKTVRYAYAPIEAIVEQVKPLLQKHGFSYTIDAPVDENSVTAICKTTHELGHSTTSSFKIPIDKDSYMSAPQKFASALTFAKRYAFCNAFGILTGDEDDDTQTISESDNVSKLVEAAKSMIEKADNATLLDYKKKLQEDAKKEKPKYTELQRKRLIKMVDSRINVIKIVEK